MRVEFTTGEADALPSSLQQIDQVVQLIKRQASLTLAVNGHTDNTGDASRNQLLPRGGARAAGLAGTAKRVSVVRLLANDDSLRLANESTRQGKGSIHRVRLLRR